jgi:PilZ domain
MEHRWGRRVDCQIPVVIEATARARLTAHIRNLSLSGAFLELSTEERLPPTVCVRFEPASATPYHRHRTWAHVVRETREGIGLEWADFAPRVIRLHLALAPEGLQIMQLVRARQSDPATGVRWIPGRY